MAQDNSQLFTLSSLPNLDDKRAPLFHATENGVLTEEERSRFPTTFPFTKWNEQQARYLDYWSWFTGEQLLSVKGYDDENKPVYFFPLGINPVRSFSRKHASFALGVETFESSRPLIKTKMKPRIDLMTGRRDRSKLDLSRYLENIVNTVWVRSHGRSIQAENTLMSQFLGGCVYQVKWKPDQKKKDFLPIYVKPIVPDFFLPVWSTDDYWRLLEAFVVYRIPARSAELEHDADNQQYGTYSIYVEHWTEKRWSVTIDGKPVKAMWGGSEVQLSGRPNLFGFVPFVYIPHVKEGNEYGSSIVEDLRGLMREYNARFSDQGDAIRLNVHPKRYMVNVTQTPVPQTVGGVKVINLGVEQSHFKNPPSITKEDPPELPAGTREHINDLWSQMLRDGEVSDGAYGAEQDKSQRSAESLHMRMLPSISHAQRERYHMLEGHNRIAEMIIEMARVKQKEIPGLSDLIPIPEDWLSQVEISQDFLPMLPRDREQELNEALLKKQSRAASLEKTLNDLGDVPDIEDEMEKIWADWEKEVEITVTQPAQVAAALTPADGESGGSKPAATPSSKSGSAPESNSKTPTLNSFVENT